MKVSLTAAARRDLVAISDHIAADSPQRARSHVGELKQKARRIGDMPRGYPLVSRYERSGIRRCVHGSYLIFYRVDEGRVVVIRILHGARDYEPILFPDG